MNFPILSAVIDELSVLLPGSFVERVSEGEGKEILISVRSAGKSRVLLISPDRSLPRLHLVSGKQPHGRSLHSFALYLRSRLPGARITRIGLVNRDRIVELGFSRRGTDCSLFAELTGRSANLLLLDARNVILAVLHPVPLSDTGTRPLIPGIAYSLPAKNDRIPGEDPGRKVPAGPDDDAGGRGGSANERAEILYRRIAAERKIASLRSELRSALNKLDVKSARLAEALSRDREAAEHAEDYKRAGELILANLNSLRTGMRQAELTGYDGEKATVLLDEKRSPARNAEQYFRKYRKARAGRDVIAARQQKTAEEGAFLKTLLSELENARREEEIVSVRSRLEQRGYLRTGSAPNKKRDVPETGAAFRKIEYRGWDIMVGKSAAGNDFITTKMAHAGDLWLHAEGLPGSHVLVRNPGGGEVPSDVLAKAASLAAYYSKGRLSGKVAVTYTFARNVRKPRGAKPGLVTLSERRTIMAIPGQEGTAGE